MVSPVIACYLLTSSVKPHYRKKTSSASPSTRTAELRSTTACTIGAPSTQGTSVRGFLCASLSASSRTASPRNVSCRRRPGAATLLTRVSVEYAWQHPHTSKSVKAYWKEHEPRRQRPGCLQTRGLGTRCSEHHKQLEMNLLLGCRGPKVPWGDDELTVIYTSELSLQWTNNLGRASHLPHLPPYVTARV